MNAADFLLAKAPFLKKKFIVGTQEILYYKELYYKVNSLALFLYQNFGSGNEILLMAENNVFYIISYLAIMKSGNQALIVETNISKLDFKSLLQNSSLKAIFIQKKFKEKLADVINLKSDKIFMEYWLKRINIKEKIIKFPTNNNQIAAIIFTSGSTGKKKGVMLTHKNIIANTKSIIKYLKLTKIDRVESVLPFFYVYGSSLLHTHLRVGGSIVINKGLFLTCIKEINKYRCTNFAGVPATYQILINHTNFLRMKFPTLKYFTQAGGKLDNKFILKIIDSFPKKLLYIMYGASEGTSRLSYLPPWLIRKKLGSIGKGIPNVNLKVVNHKGQSVKPGQIGEIIAKGDNIMQGYYRDPAGTKKVLKNGYYYTGDLATVDKDGFIYIKGRKNELIKSAGYRFSSYEIEEVLNGIEGVINCVVIAIPDDTLGEAVVAMVKTQIPTEEFRRKIIFRCNQLLPSYKTPKKIKFIEEFPLNASNKIDRLKLKEIYLLNKTDKTTNHE